MSNNNKSQPSDNLSTQSEGELKLKRESQRLFSTMQRSISSQMNSHKSIHSTLSMFTPEQVSRFLQNPTIFEKELRQLSNYLYNVNGFYKNIIQYFAKLPTYAYTLTPTNMPDKINKDRATKAFIKFATEVDKMNIKHEMDKALLKAFKEDIFYAYVVEDKTTFFLLHLDPDFCKITSKDVVYNFSFDFSFFDRNEELLNSYPDEFKIKHMQYKNTSIGKWIEIDPDNSICLKVNEDITYPLIPFGAVFEDLFNLDEYKKIKKQKTKMDNFLLLAQKIPQLDNKEMNSFAIDLDLAGQFHDALSQNVQSGISVSTSPLEITPIRMEQSKNQNDTISQATRDIFSTSGVPQQLFNSEKNTAVGINKSIIIAEQIAFSMLRQIERWVNRRLNKMSGQYKFNIKIHDVTVFNQKDKADQYQKAAASSLPVVSEYAASLGISPLELYNKAKLENEILGIHEMFTPLQTSHTQSNKEGENEVGRKSLDDNEIENDSTEAWRESNEGQENS